MQPPKDMQLVESTTEIPEELAKKIGQIIVEFAYLEHSLATLIFILSGVSPKIGRVAIRPPNATESLRIISDLLHINALTLNTDLKLFKKTLERLLTERNRIAHGIWLKTRTGFRLRVLDGDLLMASQAKTKRKINPEALDYNTNYIEKIIQEVSSTTKLVISETQRLITERSTARTVTRQN